MTFTCRTCERPWVPERKPRGQAPYWCPDCRPDALRERARLARRKYLARNREAVNAYQREYYRNHPGLAARFQKKANYKLTTEAYAALVQRAGNRCEVCGCSAEDNGRALNVDHDHSCCPGKTTCGQCVRGLLCNLCNRLLVAGYERLPEERRDWLRLNEYLNLKAGLAV